MIKRLLSLTVAFGLLQMTWAAAPAGGQAPDSGRRWWLSGPEETKKAVAYYGVQNGQILTVTLENRGHLIGTVVSMSEDSFVLKEEKTGKESTIPFAAVGRIECPFDYKRIPPKEKARSAEKKLGESGERQVQAMLASGEKITGHITKIGEDSFTIRESKTGKEVSVAYADVKGGPKEKLPAVAQADRILEGIGTTLLLLPFFPIFLIAGLAGWDGC